MPRRGVRARAIALAATAVVAAGCLRVDVEHLASDAMGGRDNGTAGSASARDFLVSRLTAIGAEGAVVEPGGVRSFLQPFSATVGGRLVEGTNVLGVIPGTELPDEYVVVGAHYDHHSTCRSLGDGDTICNGATDNATGTAAVLAVAEHIAAHPVRRSVVFALWDAEEDGLVGSAQYVQHPVVPLADTVAYVNFDILGANLRPSLRDTTFVIGAETGGPVLADIVDSALGRGPSGATRLSAIFGQARSDYASFQAAGIPIVFYSDSTGPCYHTTGDEVDVVDFAKLRRQVRMAQAVTAALADADVRPTFAAGVPLITYDDLVAIEYVTVQSLADADLLTPEQLDQLAAAHQVLVDLLADGRDEFTSDDWGPAFGAVLTLAGLLTAGPCDGFLSP